MEIVRDKKGITALILEQFGDVNSVWESPAFSVFNDRYTIEAGFDEEAGLREKAEFYLGSSLFSELFRLLLAELNEPYVLAGDLFRTGTVYESWKDLDSFDAFVNFKSIFDKNKIYKLTFPEDNVIIDYIIENGFRYFSKLYMYLPLNKVLVRFDCHFQILMWPYDWNSFRQTMSGFMAAHKDFELAEI